MASARTVDTMPGRPAISASTAPVHRPRLLDPSIRASLAVIAAAAASVTLAAPATVTLYIRDGQPVTSRPAVAADDWHGNTPWALLVIGRLPELLPADCRSARGWQPLAPITCAIVISGHERWIRPLGIVRPGSASAQSGRLARMSQKQA